jgi:hypothetical protein
VTPSAGRFVAVSLHYTLLSRNGLDWDYVPGSPSGLQDVRFAAGKFVAFEATALWATEDGSRWSRVWQGDRDKPILGLAFSGSRWVAVRYRGEPLISSDGYSWQPAMGQGLNVSAVVSGNGVLLAALVANEGVDQYETPTRILKSSDQGSTWTEVGQVGGQNQILTLLGFTGEKFVVSGLGGLWGESPDGGTWTTGTLRQADGMPAPRGLVSLAIGTKKWLAVDGPPYRVLSSLDKGTLWHSEAPGPVKVIPAGDFFVGLGAEILVSADGHEWAKTRHPDRGLSMVWGASGAATDLPSATGQP